MRVPLVDLKAQYESIREEVDEAVRRVIERGEFILGSEVEAFEEEMAAYLGVKHAVGVASGTDALQLALLACGVGPGDGVITTPFTFIATTEAIVQCGARPVFADIDPRTCNLDPRKVEQLLDSQQSAVGGLNTTVDSQKSAVSSSSPRPSTIDHRLSAVVPVHLYGQPADMDPILDLARRYNLKVIEDCAQSLGATYYSRQSMDNSQQSGVGSQQSMDSSQQSTVSSRQPKHNSRQSGVGSQQSTVPPSDYRLSTIDHRLGCKVGSLGDAGCLSFFPSKVLGAYGDGGMVVTNDAEIAGKVRMLRNHGCRQKYYHLVPGFNSRLDELQAAVLRIKLRHLDGWIEQRQQKAARYSELLGQIEGIEPPFVAPYGTHIFNYYTVRVHNARIRREKVQQRLAARGIANSPVERDRLQQRLAAQGIAAAIYYPLSLHLQEVHKDLGCRPGDFPNSEEAQEEVLSLPIYPELSDAQVKAVAEAIEHSVH